MESLRPSDPRQVGAYRLTARLGAGGMGQVFLGESPGHRKVAVKLVKPEHADDHQFRQRFAREVAAAKRVGGFHTAPVVDADPDGDPPWLVTAYIPGPSLLAAVRDNGPLAPDAVQRLGAALAEGLAAIHACGVIHRDLKPANVILAEDGPRIIDFGIARAMEASTELTGTGVAIGTVSYMSPEQVQGQRVDARSDVFSLGSVLAFAATGRSPFEAETMPATAARIMGGPPSLDGINGPLRGLIADCLAKNPAERPALPALTASLTGTALSQPAQSSTRQSERMMAAPTAPAPPSAPAGGTLAYPPAPYQPGPRPRRKGTATAVTVAAVVVAVAVGIGAYEFTSGGNPGGPDDPIATRPKAPPSLISPRFAGHWHGTLQDQRSALRGSRAATITVTKATADGKPAGTISYSDAGDGLIPADACTFASHLVSASATKVTLRETDTSGSCSTEWIVLTDPSPGLAAKVYDSKPGVPTNDGFGPQTPDPAYTGHLGRDGASSAGGSS